MLTPAVVHFGRAQTVIEKRQRVLDAAYAARPDRFARRPITAKPPDAAWINPPATLGVAD